MDYDVGVRFDAIIARQDAMAKKLDALINALSEPDNPEPKQPAAGPVEEGPAQPGMPKLGKKTPKGGQWAEP